MEIIKKFYSLISDEDRAAHYMKHYRIMTPDNMRQYFIQEDKKKKLKYYCYLVTFTLSPKNTTSAEIVEEYIRSQFLRAPLKVTEAHMTKELTKKGVPHWHVSVKTTLPLKKDRFNYYIQKYGAIDISKSRAQNLEEGINYINKSNISSKII